MTRRLAVYLFVVFYIAASIYVSRERVLLWTDWIDDAIGADRITVKAPKSSDVLGFPRFGHAYKTSRAFEAEVHRQFSAPQLVVVGFCVESLQQETSQVITYTGVARSPPSALVG